MIQTATEITRRAFLDAAKALICDQGDLGIPIEALEESSRSANRGLRLLGHAIALTKAGTYLPAPPCADAGEPLTDGLGNPLVPVVGSQVKDRFRGSLMKQILSALRQEPDNQGIKAIDLPSCLEAEYSHEQISGALKDLQRQGLISCEGTTRGAVYRIAAPIDLDTSA